MQSVSAGLSLDSVQVPCDNDDEMGRIVSALVQWQNSVVTLKLRYENQYNEGTQADSPNQKQRGAVIEWAQTDRGQRHYHYTSYVDGQMFSRQVSMYDGNRGYMLEFPQGTSSELQPAGVKILSTVPDQHLLIMPLFGLWFQKQGEWLVDLLKQGIGSIEGYKSIDGSKCPSVVLNFHPHGMSVVLDPRHDFLPREARTNGKAYFEQRVLEFRKLDVGIWFPSTGILRFIDEKGNIEMEKPWQIVEVAVNRPLGDSLFRPAIPPGTLVKDTTSSQTYYFGATTHRDEIERGIASQAKTNLASSSAAARSEKPISAVPNLFPLGFWSGGFVGIAIVLLFVAWWLFRRSG